jgi:hypothetical protein
MKISQSYSNYQILMDTNAKNIANNINNTDKNLTKELTSQIVIENGFKAQTTSIKTEDRMLGVLLDIKG